MAHLHKMVVNNICQMVCRESVALQQNRIRRNVFILPNNVSQKMIVEFRLAFQRHLQTDYVRLSCIEVCFYFFRCQMAAGPVVSRGKFVFRLDFPDSLKSFAVAETVISLAFFNQFLCVFFVKLKTFALNVRTEFTAFFTAFIPVNAEPCHCVIQVFHIFFIVACAVSVFKAQNEFAAL